MHSSLSQAEIEKLVFNLIEYMDEKLGNNQGSLGCLSETEKTVFYVYRFELEVANGGFHQFFKNPSGDNWLETLHALKRIEAKSITQLFENALPVFPDCKPSQGHLARAKQLENAGQVAMTIMDELTEAYFNLYRDNPGQDSYARMADYITKEELKIKGQGR